MKILITVEVPGGVVHSILCLDANTEDSKLEELAKEEVQNIVQWLWQLLGENEPEPPIYCFISDG